jgi:hypothetical protein
MRRLPRLRISKKNYREGRKGYAEVRREVFSLRSASLRAGSEHRGAEKVG